MSMTPVLRRWTLVAAIACLAVVPFIASGYLIFQATMILIYACAVLGLNLLMGYNGQISLGHGAFFATGAYCMAIGVVQLQIPYGLALPLAVLVSFAVGLAVGYPALRLGGIYLALATFALAVALPQLLKNRAIEPWTGGVQGTVVEKPLPPFDLPSWGIVLDQDRWMFLMALAAFVLVFWLAQNLVHGRMGRALVAIRDHPTAAAAMGVNLASVKTIMFGISAACTGGAGALAAIAVGYVAPDGFPGMLSITFLVGAVFGGVSSIYGALFGGLFILLVPNVAEQLSKSAPAAVYGVLLIVLMAAMPTGVAGAVRMLAGRLGFRSKQ
ncbi:branched-chain amino acid ABC transporter permease [Variovorax sp. J31P207]|uniref:branched-chain amino acid ABC transporter permease n=1 Tax=Variovorax sp. J31P207 TaxID=3053510 RepID=UPI002575222D|nr:branched-chain amino acid ABC transporter permease [Variovorax sp. J31P207]MDM0071427.1 branched-chain amino acid ABC transporter permease [Variovorax sp. J31P207]